MYLPTYEFFYAIVKDNNPKYQLLERIWLIFEKNVE